MNPVSTVTCRPSSERVPHNVDAIASMAWYTPHAVAGDGSPDPPSDSLVPVTCRVTVEMKRREAKIPLEGRPRLSEALQRLVQLYEATDRPDQAAPAPVG